MGNSCRPTIIIQKPSISNQLTSIYEVFICADYHDLIVFRQHILDRNPLLRRYATVSSPIPLVYSARYFVMNWRPASTFQAYNEPGLASHQDIGGVAMAATSTARITDLGFASAERARLRLVFSHRSLLLPAAPSSARPFPAQPPRTAVRPIRQAQQPRSGQ